MAGNDAIYSRYYSKFTGATFVIQAEAEAVENEAITAAVLRGAGDLLGHGIRVLLVFGKGARFEEELRAKFGAAPHAETSRLVIPESALQRIRDERARIAAAISQGCAAAGVPCQLLPPASVRVERRIGHGSTGVPVAFDRAGIRSVLDRQQMAVLGFGGEDVSGGFLHVPSVALAADLAVELHAGKLLFLMHADGLTTPLESGEPRRLSFVDFEGLLCLLQRRDLRGKFVLAGPVLPKVHACMRAVGGGVDQVHLVSYYRLLDEILTRTGVGTMVERRQTHHVDFARLDDLDEIARLHLEARQFVTDLGTPYVKPLTREQLAAMLPETLLLRHRDVIIGKLHAVALPGHPGTFQIGGFVVGENHQDSQQGQLLLSEVIARLTEQGATEAIAISASPRAQRLFTRLGGQPTVTVSWQTRLLEEARQRYQPPERDQVQLARFPLV